MAFWWVNHKQTSKQEIAGDFLWSPRRKKNGAFNQFYENMTIAAVGDVIFSYANGLIGHVGVVTDEAIFSQKPDFGVETSWSDDGWLLAVAFVALENPLRPRDSLSHILPLLPPSHSPIRENGHGNQAAYLAAIPTELGEWLLHRSGADLAIANSAATQPDIFADLDAIKDQVGLPETERTLLAKARIGQGLFRRRVLAIEPMCRVTGISDETLLRASHIKPWHESDNNERLDGSNGLMLAPHIDLLFDRHILSFHDDGKLVISTKLSVKVVSRWHLNEQVLIKPFARAQCRYLAEHRQRLL